jgi:hypothetical protein
LHPQQTQVPQQERDSMKRRLILGIALLGMSTSVSLAQSGQPTYLADPSVYKIIFEDPNFRVISATWPPDVTDKPHTHPVPSVAYFLTGCTEILRAADGTERDVNSKAGTTITVPIITQPHTAHNVGSATCRAIFVERK